VRISIAANHIVDHLASKTFIANAGHVCLFIFKIRKSIPCQMLLFFASRTTPSPPGMTQIQMVSDLHLQIASDGAIEPDTAIILTEAPTLALLGGIGTANEERLFALFVFSLLNPRLSSA
jgi:hypothetical protein